MSAKKNKAGLVASKEEKATSHDATESGENQSQKDCNAKAKKRKEKKQLDNGVRLEAYNPRLKW